MLHEYRREPDPGFARELRERLRRGERARRIPRPLVRGLAIACAVGVVVALFAIPSVRVSAQALLDLFRVRRFAGVKFDQSRLDALESIEHEHGLLVLDGEETIRAPGPPRQVSSAQAASPEAGFAVGVPSYLPDSLTADSVFVQGEGAMRFSVSE